VVSFSPLTDPFHAYFAPQLPKSERITLIMPHHYAAYLEELLGSPQVLAGKPEELVYLLEGKLPEFEMVPKRR
jgi:hypothetical protein